MTNEPRLLVSDAYGIYVPQAFTDRVDYAKVLYIDREDWEIIQQGPTADNYWEAWDCILSNAIIVSTTGARFYLHQDGDLWAVPVEYTFDDVMGV